VLCFRVLPRTSLASPAGHSNCNSRPFNSLRALFPSRALFCGSCRLFSTACALFFKNTRVGVPLRRLCALCGSALSLAVDFVRPLFSSIYELPPHGYRFATFIVSCSYELPFSQLLSIHIDANCRGCHPFRRLRTRALQTLAALVPRRSSRRRVSFRLSTVGLSTSGATVLKSTRYRYDHS
jgi:hypothetical protein